MHTLLVVAFVFAIGAFLTRAGTRLIERAHPPRGRFVDVDGSPQHVVETGAGEGTPIVLVHGAGCNLEDMRLALGARLAARHRLVFIDRPGHGWSGRRDRAWSSPAYQAAVLRDVLDRIGVGRAILVGHSWGGALAAVFALNNPDRVAGLVLLAPPLYPRLRRMTWLYAVLATRGLGAVLAHTVMLPIGIATIGLGFCAAFLPQRPPRHYLKRAGTLLTLRPRSFLANAQDVADLRAHLRPQATRYATLAMPTIVMTGNWDTILSPRHHAKIFAAAVPGAKLVWLTGVGHMLHYAAADRVVAAIEDVAKGEMPVANEEQP